MEQAAFKASNPWPAPEPDSEQHGRVWRAWLLIVETDIDASELVGGDTDADVQIVAESQQRLIVRIRSDDPTTCDVHELLHKTRKVLRSVDARWRVVTIQGVPKDRWLFMRESRFVMMVDRTFRFTDGSTVFVGRVTEGPPYIPAGDVELVVGGESIAGFRIDGERMPSGALPGSRAVETHADVHADWLERAGLMLVGR